MATSDEYIRMSIAHSVVNLHADSTKPFALNLTIPNLKDRLEKVVGTAPQWQQLQIRDTHSHEVIVDDLSGLSDGATLGEVIDAIDPEQRASLQIYVNDADPSNFVGAMLGGTVDKVEMSDEEYAKRSDSVRAIKAQRKKENELASLRVKYCTGQRCSVAGGMGGGTIRFVGELDGANGFFIGVELDEATGKNDGEAKGKRYFECAPLHGVFVRPTKVEPE